MKAKPERVFDAGTRGHTGEKGKARPEVSFVSLFVRGGVLIMMAAGLEVSAQEAGTAARESVSAPVAGGQQNQAADSGKSDESMEGGDLGRQLLLRRRERPRLFQVSSDTQYLYDSNVLLADGDFIQEGEDAVFIQNFGVSFSPPLLERLTSTFSYHHDIVRYDKLNKSDFDGDTGVLRLSHPVKDWFDVYGGFSAGRSYFQGRGGEFFKFYDTRFGIGREQPLTRRALLTYGYQFDWRPSSPSEFTRVDNAGYLGLNVALMEKVTAQLLYRARVRNYLQTDRTDLDHLVSLALVYTFNDCISARVAGTYGDNNSNKSTLDYRVFAAGGGLGLTLKF